MPTSMRNSAFRTFALSLAALLSLVNHHAVCVNAFAEFGRTHGAAKPAFEPSRWMSAVGDADHGEAISRRDAFGRGISSSGAAAALLTLAAPPPAAAAASREPVTPETVSAAFAAVRYELADPSGGVAYLEGRISAGDWDAILEFTKTYDGEFRRAKMGRARKLLTDKKLKDDAVLMCNAVTFDLIGINRASRSGKENQDEAMKYLGALKADIQKFLDLESTVDFSVVES